MLADIFVPKEKAYCSLKIKTAVLITECISGGHLNIILGFCLHARPSPEHMKLQVPLHFTLTGEA